MKKILVPTDFSEQAGFALDMARQIALKNDAEIILLNVLDVPGGAAFAGGPSFDVMGGPGYTNQMDNVYVVKLHDQSKKRLEEIIGDDRFQNIKISYKLQMGSPYTHISEEIAENNVNLVVMGTTGASGVEEFLIGSNTEKVVRLAKCPVLTVKEEVNADKIKDIVFASNFIEEQKNVVDELLKLQKLFDAKLHLVKVNTPSNFESTRKLNREIGDFAQRYHLANYQIHIYSHELEEEGIIYFSDDIKADMIALATHGRTGIMHLLSGSIAEDVVNHAKRPVWTFRLK